MKRFGVLLVISSGCLIAQAQNLVPNPSFEELSRCPHSFSADRNDFIVPGWTSPSAGTPDHFHKCSWGEADVPYNWAGASNAKSGHGYCGMYIWNNRLDKSYREYIQCELAEPLKAGRRYKAEFYFKLASYSVYTANRIGLVLTDSAINVNHDHVINIVPLISIETDSAITKTTGGWEVACREFIAKGGERFLTIGNFFDNATTKSLRLPYRYGKSSMLSSSAYYFIDDVSVVSLDTLPEPVQQAVFEFNQENIELDKDYILKNIQFEFDSYVLKKSSHEELNKVVTYLKGNPYVQVRLSGHTDFIGSDEYNQTLSRNRARSVAEYLIEKGIHTRRIISYGFGKSRPIMLDKTDEARSINRRVEIRFITP
jgi:OmpA-OmpF porin, OOP family